MALSKEHFAELLTRAKAAASLRKEKEALEALQTSLATHQVDEISLVEAGGSNETSAEAQEHNLEVLSSLTSSMETSSPRSALLNGSAVSSLSSGPEYVIDPILGIPVRVSTSLPRSPNLSVEVVEEKEAAEGTEHQHFSLSLPALSPPVEVKSPTKIGVTRNVILNTKQSAFNDLVLSGRSCVLIGAAGTGKTTSMRTVTRNLIDGGSLLPMRDGTKHLRVGVPGAAILSFTRKAVNNIRHAVVEELKPHTLTIHKLLEFAPEFYEIEDPEKPGNFKKTMRFVPGRNSFSPLPRELTFLAFEESSMISTVLYEQLQEAMPHEYQEVFLGDIQQLPPIFGQAILGFKMLELPLVELTEVYRQAAESPIIDLAWKILSGDKELFSPLTRTDKSFNERLKKDVSRITVPALEALSRSVILENGEGTTEVKFQPWQKALNEDYAILTSIRQFTAWAAQGYYNPSEDVILCPYNKAVGTIEVNKGISDYLGKQRGAEVHEVIAGFNRYYLAVGDRVLYDKEDAFIVGIRKNGKYLGKTTLPSSTYLDRWGHLATENMTGEEKRSLAEAHDGDLDLAAVEAFLDGAGASVEERVTAASHVVEIRYAYSEEFEEPIVLEDAAEINNLLGGYCITVHKFQGSEAERVFLLLHHTHQKMCSRELLYTAVTRARRFLHIICEKDTFYKGVQSQKIKGNTIEEKAEWFKGKVPPATRSTQTNLNLEETEGN